MEAQNEMFPKTIDWINTLHPLIIIRGEKSLIVKFSDGREPLLLGYDKIMEFEKYTGNEEFFWG